MSSVIVKGMDMPSSCSSCRFKWNGDSTCYCTAQVGDERHRNIHVIKGSESDIGNKREDGCPLVEIPSGHGRLIDGDKAEHELFNYYPTVNRFSCKERYRGDTLMDYEVAQMIDDCVSDSPTILEAEGEKE